ncbi:MAG TPA: sodium-dependent transporter [Phycisphaerales bacterium]|nr:sodium-dependent transporter [Phycisphaerales bacterium]
MATERAQWGSKLGFILAASGSAVGLGNIWRFPYVTGENGGGWFVVIYLVCIALVGLPILMSEIMIGRAAQRQPVGAFAALEGRRTAWSGVGWLGVVAGFIILSFYIVVAGWAMDYTLKSIVNFTGPMAAEARVEAMAYRADTPAVEMRETLIDAETARQFREVEKEITRKVRPSAWKAYQEFESAVAKASNAEHARAVLLEDAALRAHVEVAQPIAAELEAAHLSLRQRVSQSFDALSEVEIRDRAEDFTRRSAIRSRVEAAFGAVAGDGWITAIWTCVFMLLTILIVAGGVSSGIERACTILMPALFLLILVLVIYGFFMPGFREAASFVFKPDIHELRPSGVLAGMGQAFFSLSLGMGALITYGSYQRTKRGLAGESVTIAAMDTGVALLACLMIFPIVFSFGQAPSAGPGLVFMSMPLAFAEIGQAGMLLGAIFFGLLVFAAITSSISLLEVVASYFIDERGWSRRKATWVVGGLVLLLSMPSAFSYAPDSFISGWTASYGSNFDFLSTMDYLASNWMLPAGGFFISLYAGWVMPKHLRNAELEGLAPALVLGWLLLVRFVAPAMVIVILMQSIGILDADELLFRGG